MTAASVRLPGRLDMWVFVIGDLWIFSCYFACYLYDHGRFSGEFLRGQEELSQTTGMVATVVLLTSSLFAARGRFTAAGAAGVVFLGLKGAEWAHLIAAGHTLGSSRFFLYYFMMTGLHALHVVFGLGVLRYTAASLKEVGATYWHLVDLIWIVVFALLYLVR